MNRPAPPQSDYGSPAIPITIDDVATGTRSTVKRARRADPLTTVDGCTPSMRAAASVFRQAVEHVDAGLPMGALPWAADRVSHSHGGAGLLAQERAISAAEWCRRGTGAMGARGTHVVLCVAVHGMSLVGYDAMMCWRKGGGKSVMLASLSALADEYGC